MRRISRETSIELETIQDQGTYQGNSKTKWTNNELYASFSEQGDVHQLLIPTSNKQLNNGYSFTLKLWGWKEIKYLALGYNRKSDNKFIHVKIPNPKQCDWFNFSVSHNDIIFKLQNNWELHPPTEYSAIRIYIKGTFSEQAELYLKVASTWLEEASNSLLSCPSDNINEELIELIKDYWKACYPEYAKQARDYLLYGHCPIGSYPVMTNQVRWSPLSTKPVTLASSTTYRYSWHALNAVSVFILAYDEAYSSAGLLCSARELVSDWIRESYFDIDQDQKYCWYDHGTAERTLVLVVMYELGIKYHFDQRFMARLYHVLIKHAQLMENEAFYASHQPTRYHNHAWFQDIALIASAIALKNNINTRNWISRAIERLTDQFTILINQENEYSIFTENSIGYHGGIIRIVDFAGKLANLSEVDNNFSDTAKKLEKWAAKFVYPDGRMPAQGDTFRKPNPAERNQTTTIVQWTPEIIALPKSGYLLIKGGVQNCPWMFSMLATNLNSTHKHEDDLSFTIWLDGVEWLIDPGFYSHEYQKEVPRFLRSASAHNHLFINGKAYSIVPESSRLDFNVNENSLNDMQETVTLNGHCRAYKDYEISRNMECAKDSQNFHLYCIDIFSSSNNSSENVDGYIGFHFGDGVTIEKKSNKFFVLTHPASTKTLHLVFSEKSIIEEMKIQDTVSGLGFMQQVVTKQLIVKIKPEKECVWELYVNE